MSNNNYFKSIIFYFFELFINKINYNYRVWLIRTMLHVLLISFSVFFLAEAQLTPKFRPPAVPLIVTDPYSRYYNDFSICKILQAHPHTETRTCIIACIIYCIILYYINGYVVVHMLPEI